MTTIKSECYRAVDDAKDIFCVTNPYEYMFSDRILYEYVNSFDVDLMSFILIECNLLMESSLRGSFFTQGIDEGKKFSYLQRNIVEHARSNFETWEAYKCFALETISPLMRNQICLRFQGMKKAVEEYEASLSLWNIPLKAEIDNADVLEKAILDAGGRVMLAVYSKYTQPKSGSAEAVSEWRQAVLNDVPLLMRVFIPMMQYIFNGYCIDPKLPRSKDAVAK